MSVIDGDLRWRVLYRDEFRCAYCGRTADGDGVRIDVDHLVPVSAGGPTNMQNLVACCTPCNQGKADTALSRQFIERIVASRRIRLVGTGEVKYGDEVLDAVRELREMGMGYKGIAREIGVNRDTARYLVQRAERQEQAA